jgi:putative adenylate-forming enzyme
MKRLIDAWQRALHLWRVLKAYRHCRGLRFDSRTQLKQHQAQQIMVFTQQLSQKSPYFSAHRNLPLNQWPTMDKAIMMAQFNTMNTAGLDIQEVMGVAQNAERQRHIEPKIGPYTVGLSSGTSAMRGAFVVSDAERAQWAGIMLAKSLPKGLFSGERVALFLRANSPLYTAVRSRWLKFEYFDLFQPLQAQCERLQAYQASVIVAPAQVLLALAKQVHAGALLNQARRVISVAEVLSATDRAVIEQAFGSVHEIYQATEGFLASTCEQGTLHLNEEYVHIEPDWLDETQRRFVPIITDFTRQTQPIVRYRLNDVLRVSANPCRCGRVTRAIEAIEGRCDDMLQLPSTNGAPVTVFADVLSRALAQCLPLNEDYRLIQIGVNQLVLHTDINSLAWHEVRTHLNQVFTTLGVNAQTLVWRHERVMPQQAAHIKLRRIVRIF